MNKKFYRYELIIRGCVKIIRNTMIVGTLLAIIGANLSASATVAKPNSIKLRNSTVAKLSSYKTKWTIDLKGMRFTSVSAEEQENLTKFSNGLKQGLSPREAAQQIQGANYRKLEGTSNQYEFNISSRARVRFHLNEKDRVVKIIEAGSIR